MTKNPAKKAKGKIKAAIPNAIFNPLSFIVIENWAMQGMKRARVTIETIRGIPLRMPASFKS